MEVYGLYFGCKSIQAYGSAQTISFQTTEPEKNRGNPLNQVCARLARIRLVRGLACTACLLSRNPRHSLSN